MTPRRLPLLLAALAVGCAAPRPEAPSYRPAALQEAPPDGAPADAARNPSAPLTLDDCVRITLENNRQVRIADRRILIAHDRVNESIAGLLPKLSAEGRYEHRSNRYGFNFGDMAITIDQRDTVSARVGVLVPVYDFEQTNNRIEGDRRREDAAGDMAEKTRQDLVLDVARSYYRVLEARKVRAVVEESLKAIGSQLAIAQDFLRVGMTARNDLLVVAVQYALRHLDRIQAESNVQLAEATLARVMGVDVSRPPAIADVADADPRALPLDAAMRLAVERRPDLRALRRQIEAARADYRATADAWLPRIDAFGGYNYSADKMLVNADWWSGGFTVQFPFLDGGATAARTAQAGRRIDETIDAHDDRVDDVLLDVKRAWLADRTAAEKIPVGRLGILLGEENLRMTRDQYREGLVTSAEVLQEEDRLSQARVELARALYSCRIARATLENAVGGALPPPVAGEAVPVMPSIDDLLRKAK
jgi:outer membrane protein TolC